MKIVPRIFNYPIIGNGCKKKFCEYDQITSISIASVLPAYPYRLAWVFLGISSHRYVYILNRYNLLYWLMIGTYVVRSSHIIICTYIQGQI